VKNAPPYGPFFFFSFPVSPSLDPRPAFFFFFLFFFPPPPPVPSNVRPLLVGRIFSVLAGAC